MDILIVGLDGLEPRLVDEWLDDLPILSKLSENGTFGRIRSSDPPLSAPAWPWMFTGKQGGKHGCFGFTKRKSDSYQREPINYSDIQAESMWEALDDAGVACGVVNVPLTYPPISLKNGYVVAGWPVPNRVTVSDPPDIIEDVEAEIGEKYRVNPFPTGPELEQAKPDRVADLIKKGIRHHESAFVSLAKQQDVDVFFCVSMATDVAGHHLYSDLDCLKEIYREQDRALGSLLDTCPSTADTIVLSDHGHAAESRWKFFVNEWLHEKGYLEVENQSISQARAQGMRRLGITRENLLWLKNVIGIGDVRELLPQPVFNVIKRFIPAATEGVEGFDANRVDWGDTLAFGSNQNVISLNVKNLHPNGTVDPAERRAIAREIMNELETIKHPDPERSDPLISEMTVKDNIFAGPYADQAPDIVVIADDMHCPVLTGFNNGEHFSSNDWGEHRQYGTFITAGQSFTRKGQASDCEIVDVFPMVLSLLGVPLPDNIDGDIPQGRLEHSIDPEFRPSRDEFREPADREYSEEENEQVKEQLQGLGYLE